MLLQAAAARAEVQVVSPGARDVSITIYRDNFALVTETRTLDLPAGKVSVEFQGVAESLLPQSAVLLGAGRPAVGTDYRYDPLTPASLLERSVGEQVLLTRTSRQTGRVRQEPATIVAVNDGVVFRSADGVEALHCSGLPERLVFNRLPDGLGARPALSIELAGGQPGPREVRLSYIASGFAWSADYVARLNARSDRMNLSGWATLRNLTHTGFARARVQVVAGDLHVLPAEQGGSQVLPGFAELDDAQRAAAQQQYAADIVARRLAASGVGGVVVGECQPVRLMPVPATAQPPIVDLKVMRSAAPAALQEMVVTAARLATREQLADYQLYRLPGQTDLAALQTKQVAFLARPAVTIERFYRLRLPAIDSAPQPQSLRADVMVGWENRESAGLGEPLPGGQVRFFAMGDTRSLFVGEASMQDKPVGLPVELAIGKALDLALNLQQEDERAGGARGRTRLRVATELQVDSGKSRPVQFELRQGLGAGWTNGRVTNASRRFGRKGGDYSWRFTLPPDATTTLSYRLEALGP